MPRVTQYIRDGDLEKWNSIPNKSEFIHNALQAQRGFVGKVEHVEIDSSARATGLLFDKTGPVGPPIKVEDKVIPVPVTDRFKQGVCKIHGLPLDNRGRCLQKGCKYA